MKDNYVGDHINFVTLEEYRSKQPSCNNNVEGNDFEISCTLFAHNNILFLPEHLYNFSSDSKVSFHEFSSDFRLTCDSCGNDSHVTLETQIQCTPLYITREGNLEFLKHEKTSGDGFIHISSIKAHSFVMYGPPPAQKLYHSKYKMWVGKISGDLSPKFFNRLLNFSKCFNFTWSDKDNSMILPDSQSLDILLMDVVIDDLSCSLWTDNSCISLNTNQLNLKSGNQGDYDVFNLNSDLSVQFLTKKDNSWVEVANISTAINLSKKSKSSSSEEQKAEFSYLQDYKTQRMKNENAFNFLKQNSVDSFSKNAESSIITFGHIQSYKSLFANFLLYLPSNPDCGLRNMLFFGRPARALFKPTVFIFIKIRNLM